MSNIEIDKHEPQFRIYPMYNGILKGMPVKYLYNGTGEECVDLPVWTVLIDHPQGKILFDTAMRHYSNSQNVVVDEHEQLPNVLKQHGLTPDQIDYVVCSHLHFDHTGYLDLFKKSKILVSKSEYNNVKQQYEESRIEQGYEACDVKQWFSQKMDWVLIGEEEPVQKLFDGVSILNLGRGHAYGMLGLLLETQENGNIILAADVIYCRKNTENYDSRQLAYIDKKAYDDSYDLLMHLAKEYDAQIWFGHDMKQVEDIMKQKVYL